MTQVQRQSAIIAGALAIGFFLGGASFRSGLFSEQVAAWVQGIGTIGALIATWVLARLESGEARRREKQARIDFVNGVSDAADLALRCVEPVMRALNTNDEFAATARGINDADARALEAWTKEPISNWPSPQLFVRCETLQNARGRFVQVARNFSGTMHTERIYQTAMREADADLRKADAAFRQCIAGIPLN